MERDEDVVECWECGAAISPGADRTYAISDEEFLCCECAVRRGGVYDENEDRWLVLPKVDDLQDERRPHP